MKKIIIFGTLFLISVFAFSYAYAIKCPKCIEENKNNKQVMGDVGIAQRDFSELHVHKNGKIYAVYRCCYGHKILVYLNDEK